MFYVCIFASLWNGDPTRFTPIMLVKSYTAFACILGEKRETFQLPIILDTKSALCIQLQNNQTNYWEYSIIIANIRAGYHFIVFVGSSHLKTFVGSPVFIVTG